MLELIEELTNTIDNKESTIGVFIDLKKAFDTIDHSLLLKKIENYGIRGKALNWVKSYLNNRQQYVYFNDTKSDVLNISCGVHEDQY